MVNKVLFSKKSDHWRTPTEIYEHFIKIGFWDPCPLNACFDGLAIDWKKKVFVNPPYSNIRAWLLKGKKEIKKGNSDLIVYLVPARTCTKWFHELVYKKHPIKFIKGRLKFQDEKGSKNSAPFPSMYIYMSAGPLAK